MGVSKKLFVFGSILTPMPSENRSNYKKIQVWIPLPLWNELVSMGYSSPTNAVITALQLLTTKSQDTPVDSQETPMSTELGELKIRLEEKSASDEIRITELKENYQNRMEDLKSHIYSLDNQMRTKDDQIEKLNENMHKQAVHLQTLLNQKAIEAPGAKKPFWKFW